MTHANTYTTDLDTATIRMLWHDTPRSIRKALVREVRSEIPAYDSDPDAAEIDPCAERKVCAADDCFTAFWSSPRLGTERRVYCCDACCSRAFYKAHGGVPEYKARLWFMQRIAKRKRREARKAAAAEVAA